MTDRHRVSDCLTGSAETARACLTEILVQFFLARPFLKAVEKRRETERE
jgi:hypothetical protein